MFDRMELSQMFAQLGLEQSVATTLIAANGVQLMIGLGVFLVSSGSIRTFRRTYRSAIKTEFLSDLGASLRTLHRDR